MARLGGNTVHSATAVAGLRRARGDRDPQGRGLPRGGSRCVGRGRRRRQRRRRRAGPDRAELGDLRVGRAPALALSHAAGPLGRGRAGARRTSPEPASRAPRSCMWRPCRWPTPSAWSPRSVGSRPDTLITLDTHEDWVGSVRDRLLDLARSVDVFEPSLEELRGAHGLRGRRPRAWPPWPPPASTACVVKAGADGAYLLADGADRARRRRCRPGRRHDRGRRRVLRRSRRRLASGSIGSTPSLSASRRPVRRSAPRGSLRLLEPGWTRRRLRAPAGVRPAVAAARPGWRPARPPWSSERRRPASDIERTAQPYAIDVMRREIAMIPDVVAAAVDDPEGRLTSVAKSMLAQDISHLWLTGCGDSAFAGQAVGLAFQRHTAIDAARQPRARPVALRVRYLPSGQRRRSGCRSPARSAGRPRRSLQAQPVRARRRTR